MSIIEYACRPARLAVGCAVAATPLIGALVFGAVGAPPAQAAVELLSHRAVYALSLARESDDAAGISDIQGGLVIEWRDSCVGAITTQRLGFVARVGDAPDFTYDVRFSSWESPDHDQLRFIVRSFDGGVLFEEFEGEASVDEAGGKAVFVEPAGETLTLPRGTLFPTEHMRRLIEGAQDGEVVVSHDVFDGSGLDGLSRITAVIGRPVTPATGGGPDADDGAERAADGGRRWPVSLAYHEATGADDMPTFELTFALAESGVLYDLVLDYGDFALQADLEQLEAFESPTCP